MRIRSIRPEFWSSEDVAAMDWHTRLVFIGLWSYVDDNGVGRDVPRLIVAALFPLDEDQSESSRRVAAGISALVAGGQVTRYMVDGKPYLHITSWATHQRTDNKAKDRYPLPTSTNAIAQPPSAVARGESRRVAADRGYGEGEKGRRGEESPTPADADDTPEASPEALHLCRLLADLIEANGSKRPEIGKGWLDAARLMLTRDGRDAAAAETLIRWCQDDDFWRSNILSMPKFRQKYDQLRLQAAKVVELRPASSSGTGEASIWQQAFASARPRE